MKNNKKRKELLGMIEDLTFDFSDAMYDLGAGIRCDELPNNAVSLDLVVINDKKRDECESFVQKIKAIPITIHLNSHHEEVKYVVGE